VAAALKDELSVTANLVKGDGGIFTVEVGERVVARKAPVLGFPTDAQVVLAVKDALAE